MTNNSDTAIELQRSPLESYLEECVERIVVRHRGLSLAFERNVYGTAALIWELPCGNDSLIGISPEVFDEAFSYIRDLEVPVPQDIVAEDLITLASTWIFSTCKVLDATYFIEVDDPNAS